MAYQNFIPTIWAEQINRELERACVFAEDCNRQYEGKVTQYGDSVRILGVGKPTITRTTDKNVTLSTPEFIEDTSVTMPIQQIATFNYQVGDIDKRQAVGGLMDALAAETTEALANEMDQYVADMAKKAEAVKDNSTAYQVTVANILNSIDAAQTALFKKDVSVKTELVLTVSPDFYNLLKQAYVALDTNNSKMLENGRVGRYGNIVVKMSNNIARTGATEQIMLRTKRAIAFVNPMTHTEAYRPEGGFSDAVKGFVLFDGKIVRPKELVVMNVKYTA